MKVYKIVKTNHMPPRDYYYRLNDDEKWERLTSYQFTHATLLKDYIIEKQGDVVYYTVDNCQP